MNTYQDHPKDGVAGLKEHYTSDAISGFIVFLLALPLSLGIAKASEFPPLMGLLTAIIGGLLVSLLAGSPLTIKGPAAGLIVIILGAVNEFGGGELGWRLSLGAIVVAGFIQVLFGLFKWGKLVDFFPLSAVHGMLAAIGMIIMLKQFPVMLNVDPAMAKGKSPFELMRLIPDFIQHLDRNGSIVGLLSLGIMLLWPQLPLGALKKIPAALVVLTIAIPAELLLDFKHTEPASALVHVGDFLQSLKINVSFEGLHQTGTFIKYVVMFALVGSLESLLTVKAIDLMDPYKRKSNTNKDLIAVGLGNMVAGFLGGLPMISEVARSSSNVNNGAKTRWGNFFHGCFILGFLVFAKPLIELIPNAALAAMLISVGIRLAHPKEFIHIFQIGAGQLAIFLCTIIFTLEEDLLVGIAAGIVLKLLLHIWNGGGFKNLFVSNVSVSFNENQYLVEVQNSAVFSNYLGLKSKLEAIPQGMNVQIDFSQSPLIDHSVLENLQLFIEDYQRQGGQMELIGMQDHKPLSNHPLAARKK